MAQRVAGGHGAGVHSLQGSQKRIARVKLLDNPFSTVSAGSGFLPLKDPLRRLDVPGAEAWEQALDEVPKLIVAGGDNGLLRRTLASLPPFPLESLLPEELMLQQPQQQQDTAPITHECDGPRMWRAYFTLSFMAHAYMWCESGPTPQSLPATIAKPWVTIAEALDMPPVLVYATYNLLNWRRLNQSEPVELGNVVCLQNFMASMDEEWFRLVHVAIEAAAGPALSQLPTLREAAVAGDTQQVEAGLSLMCDTLQHMQALLGRMGEKCDPQIYYKRVRQPMSGWRNNPLLPDGLLYEGTGLGRLQLYGETGAQSSIVPAFDAVLGIQHESQWLRDYLWEMRRHMPPEHRAFIAHLKSPAVPSSSSSSRGGGGGLQDNTGQQHSSFLSLRNLAREGPPSLRDAYNEAVHQLEKFRSQHKAFAYAYIAAQAERERAAAGLPKGTGGTDFMPALKGYQETTASHRL